MIEASSLPCTVLYSVPACPEAGLPLPGVLLLTLGSLWFWEHNPAEGSLVPHRLPTPPGSLFWSLRYQQDVGPLHCPLCCTPLCRPGWCWWCASPPRCPPTSCWSWRPGRSRRAGRSLPTHVSPPALCDHLTRLHCTAAVMTSEGGSYAARSFLRSSLVPGPAGQVLPCGQSSALVSHCLLAR